MRAFQFENVSVDSLEYSFGLQSISGLFAEFSLWNEGGQIGAVQFAIMGFSFFPHLEQFVHISSETIA